MSLAWGKLGKVNRPWIIIAVAIALLWYLSNKASTTDDKHEWPVWSE